MPCLTFFVHCLLVPYGLSISPCTITYASLSDAPSVHNLAESQTVFLSIFFLGC